MENNNNYSVNSYQNKGENAGKFQVVKERDQVALARKENGKTGTVIKGTTTAAVKPQAVSKKLPSSGPGDVMLAIVIIASVAMSMLVMMKNKLTSYVA